MSSVCVGLFVLRIKHNKYHITHCITRIRSYARLQITPHFTLMFKQFYGVGFGSQTVDQLYHVLKSKRCYFYIISIISMI